MYATHATVFVGGFAPHARALDEAIGDSLVIAADSGWEHAVASGRQPHVLVGDMDSISPAHLADAIALGTEVILVAAKVIFDPALPAGDVSRAIDDAEANMRAAVPHAKFIFIEPDVSRTQSVS